MYKFSEPLSLVSLQGCGDSEGVPEPPGPDVGVRLVAQEPLPGPGPVCDLQPPLAQPHRLSRDHRHGVIWLQLP